jgi:hypothetical protein
MADNLTNVKKIIDKLTIDQHSILSEKVFNLAAELGIGDNLVQDCLNQLREDNYIAMPMPSIVKRI